MTTAVAFVFAASAGALARAEFGRRWNRHDGFAWGTLAVNVAGCFVLGLLHDLAAPALTVAGVAGIGAFTTFSSFARDAVALAEARKIAASITYVTVTYAASITAAAAGVALA